MRSILLVAFSVFVAACAGSGVRDLTACLQPTGAAPDYLIGPGDSLEVFVWRNADLSTTVPVGDPSPQVKRLLETAT